MPEEQDNKNPKLNNAEEEEKLKTDEPLSERDEVKKAEERTRKAQSKVNEQPGDDSK